MTTGKLTFCIAVFLLQAVHCSAETLSQAVGQALLAQPSIRASRANLQAAKSDAEVAKAQAGPNASLQVNAGPMRQHTMSIVGSDTVVSATFTGTQTVFDGGVTEADRRRTASAISAADARLVDSVNMIGLETVQTYLEILRLTNARAALLRDVSILQTIVAKMRLRVRGGFGNDADLYEGKARVEAARVQLVEVEQQLQNATADYVALVGAPPTRLEPVHPYWGALPLNVDDVISAARKRSPKILAMRYDALAAAAVADGAQAQTRPKLDLVVRADRSAYLTSSDNDSSTISAQFSLRVNLYDGGAAEARHEVARHAADAGRLSAEAKALEIDREVMKAWNSIYGSASRIEPLRLEHEAALRSLSANLKRFEAGFSTLEKLMDLQNQVTSTELAILNENVSRHYNTFLLLAATGQLIDALALPSPHERRSP